MGQTASAIKTVVIPAIIALLIFLLLSFILVPLWKRYRTRYGQYLPLESISDGTSSLRHRFQSGIARFLVPSRWRQSLADRLVVDTSGAVVFEPDDIGDGSESGEELGDVQRNEGRRGRESVGDVEGRLSRDLEQGFMDDSSDEDEDTRAR